MGASASAEPAAKSVSKHAKAHISKKVVASKAKSKSSTVAKSTVVPLPDRNPAAPANPPPQTEDTAPAPRDAASLPSPAPQITQAVADPAMPLPDLNPQRPSSISLVVAKPGSIGIPSQAPAMDFATILKPLLNYDISAADEANLKEAIRLAFRGDSSSKALIEKIKDDAARKLATWYAYKASGLNISAEAIEQFRLANPEWPAQDELRERAEAALLLDDAPADEVKAFVRVGPKSVVSVRGDEIGR